MAVCSELRQLVGSADARFGLISAGKRDGDNHQHHVVYWSNHGNGFILKGYNDTNEAERELKASVKARDSLPNALKLRVPVVERLFGLRREGLAEADSSWNMFSGRVRLVIWLVAFGCF